ncbi:MAG: InlB B-repeat-containing protein [Johnsonella sp.]|nr:InlB B-repeat-containing protein [Johnsonella sp.]
MNNKFLRKARRGLAAALSAAMVFSGLPVLGGMEARAATELQENTVLSDPDTLVHGFQYIGSAGSAIVYGNASGHQGTNSWSHGGSSYRDHYTFDMGAITDDAHKNNKSKGFYATDPTGPPNAASTVKTSYGSNWFAAYYAFGKPYRVGKIDPANLGAPYESGVTVDPKPTYAANNVEVASATFNADNFQNFNPIIAGSPMLNGQVSTVSGPGGKEVEVRTEFKPSSDGQWIILEYTVHNKTAQEVDFNIGHETDTQLYNHDACPIIVTEQDGAASDPDAFEGLHMIANAGSTYQFSNCDIITYHPDPVLDLGMQKRDGADKSEARVWAGRYSTTGGQTHSLWAFSKSPKGLQGGFDSSGAFSAYFNLKPRETKSVRFGLSMKTAVYYVKAGATGGTGFIATPYGSIKEALDKIKSLSGLKKAYIYLMSDVELDQKLVIPDGLSLTIQTTDFTIPEGTTYNTSGTYYYSNAPEPYENSAPRKKIIRKAGFNEEFFTLGGANSTLVIGDVTLDGGNSDTSTKPLISASQGKVEIKRRAVLENNKVNAADTASAIDISGSAHLDMNYGTIKGNTSMNGSAVHLGSSKEMTLQNTVVIHDNKDINGAQANLHLKSGKKVKVLNTLGSESKIGVNVETLPGDNEHSTLVAIKEPSLATVPYSTLNFPADKEGTLTHTGDPSKKVTDTADTNTPQDPQSIYLAAPKNSLSIAYVDTSGNILPPAVLPPGFTNPINAEVAAGSVLNYAPPAATGYRVKRAFSSPPNSPAVDPVTGVVNGIMPGANLNITVEYEKIQVRYLFDANGGTIGGQPRVIKEENVSTGPSILGSPPIPSRVGYDFGGWRQFTDDGNEEYNGEPDLNPGAPAFDAYPNPAAEGITYLFAKWNPGTGQFPLSQSHKNSNPSVRITFATKTENKTFNSSQTIAPAPIPCYLYNELQLAPALGYVSPGNGNHTFNMPAGGVSANYTYKVNLDPSQRKRFIVEHKPMGGTSELSPSVEVLKSAEQMIEASKLTIPGYTYATFEIAEGGVGDPAQYIVGLDTPALVLRKDEAAGVFKGYMPNQDVKIIFRYTSDTTSNLQLRYRDKEDNAVLYSKVDPKGPGETVSQPIPNINELYGYTWINGDSSANVEPASVGSVDASGVLNITMPVAVTNVKAEYKLSRDPGKWREIEFDLVNAPYNTGSIEALPAGAPTKFLANDGTPAGDAMAYDFAKLESKGYIPATTPNNYYMFDGWYTDPAGTIKVQPTDKFPTGAGSFKLYAKFVEDPSKWIDIHFDKAAHITNSLSPLSLHKPFDYTWNMIAAELPAITPEVNYEFDKWTLNGAAVDPSAVLVNGATYIAHAKKSAAVWGLNVGDFTPIGRVSQDGSGEIAVRDTQAGNVYIVSDMNGNIIDVITSPADGSITFSDLYPGTRYNVQEGTPDTVAVVGQPISTITGSQVSAPKEVLIPTVEDNYAVGIDPNNEGMAQIVINPADPDSDYALIDENGNVVPYPTANNGWMSPVGSNPSTVTFDNLNPGGTYRVVARKKGDNSVPSPLDKFNEGTDITANPGDMLEAQNFVVETKGDTSSVVQTVAGNAVNLSRFDTAKKGDLVEIHTDAVNAGGQAFKYWKVVAGRNPGVVGRITSTDFSFTMTASNIVLRAVYERPATLPSNANSEEEIRGGAQGEFGLDPDSIGALEDALTTPDDEVLMDINGADVTYRIVFNKRNAKANEVSAVKPISVSGSNHSDAFNAAWGLDVIAERYVDGRLVGRATPSNATTDVIIQLPGEDTDMLDYELFDVSNPTTPVGMTMIGDPEQNAGLFSFNATIGHSYVLVYSKTFKLRFIDNNPVLDFMHLNDVSRNFYHVMKIRRKEAPTDAWYDTPQLWRMARDYRDSLYVGRQSRPTDQDGIFWEVNFADIYGVEYSFIDWSRKNMPENIQIFDPDAQVSRPMVIYAYYKDNRAEVTKARTKLTGLIGEAEVLTGNPYLNDSEIDMLKNAIAAAKARIDQRRGELLKYDFGSGLIDPQRMAIYEELKKAIDDLEALIRDLLGRIDARSRRFEGYTGGSSGGGSGSGGRGTGNRNRPLEAGGEKTFTLGVDGNWQINSATGKWSFVLNGGLPLNNAWGKIQFANVEGKLITKWYFFDHQSAMVTGWYHDQKLDKWYFLNTAEGADNGQMLKGWFLDKNGNYWYYLDPVLGEMYVGWSKIGDKWYYFEPVGGKGRPKGSLYISTTTPDGYQVNHNGEWVN